MTMRTTLKLLAATLVVTAASVLTFCDSGMWWVWMPAAGGLVTCIQTCFDDDGLDEV
jgi:hypothetical protein